MTGAATKVDLYAPPEVRWIVDTLEEAGFSAWTVGGGVRDALAGIEPGDWDVTTAARTGDVRRLFRRTVPIGIEHGTVGVLGRSGKMYEVTTFRRDVETFGRRARVEFADTIDEDLDRRDFTINALAWSPRTKELRDPHGGREDLANGVLRTVGNAEERFEEDRLRVLRALRFAGRFDLRIDPRTWDAVQASTDKLGNLSAERIREELWKVLTGQEEPSRSLRLYAESGVLKTLYPELEATRGVPWRREGKVWDHLLNSVDAVPRHRPVVRLAALLHAIGRAGEDADEAAMASRSAALARNILRRLRSSNADTDRVTHLIAQSSPLPSSDGRAPDLRRWLRRVGPEYVSDLLRLIFAICRASPPAAEDSTELLALQRRLRSLSRERPAIEVKDLAVTGSDLRALGIPPGPLYREILDDLLERVLDEPELNTRAALLGIITDSLSP